MEVHGNLDLQENNLIGAVFGIEANFPTNPRPGRFIMKEKTLYVCVEVYDTIPVWVPLTKPLNMLKYSQVTPALEWTIVHNLNTAFPIVQIFDADGNVVIPQNINCATFNRVTAIFNTPTAGIAILQRGESEGVEPPLYSYEANFTNLATWVVTHNLGYNPIVRCIIGVDEVQPLSLVHTSLNVVTITFSSPRTGSVRCI